jgi:hypothetical protein
MYIEPFLVYQFMEFEFQFMGDHIMIKDRAQNVIYKMIFTREVQLFPFLIELVKQ